MFHSNQSLSPRDADRSVRNSAPQPLKSSSSPHPLSQTNAIPHAINPSQAMAITLDTALNVSIDNRDEDIFVDPVEGSPQLHQRRVSLLNSPNIESLYTEFTPPGLISLGSRRDSTNENLSKSPLSLSSRANEHYPSPTTGRRDESSPIANHYNFGIRRGNVTPTSKSGPLIDPADIPVTLTLFFFISLSLMYDREIFCCSSLYKYILTVCYIYLGYPDKCSIFTPA